MTEHRAARINHSAPLKEAENAVHIRAGTDSRSRPH
jgi:hypothetical protein